MGYAPTAGPTSRPTRTRAFRSLQKIAATSGGVRRRRGVPGPAGRRLFIGRRRGLAVPSYRRRGRLRILAFGANVGGQHPHSLASTDVLREARGALGDLLHCESDEVVFGPSATALVVHVARALGGTWSAGDNVVLSIVAAGVPALSSRPPPRRRRLGELVRHRRDKRRATTPPPRRTKHNATSRRPTTTATSSPGSSPRSGRAVKYDT